MDDNGANCYRRFLDGDESGFDEVLELYHDGLIFFINRYVHNITIAEDLAEDAFLELIIHKHRYHFRTSLKTYLFTIGRNKALNHLKHASKLVQVDMDAADLEAADLLTLEEHVLYDERKQKLNAALGALNEDSRTAIHLVHFEGLSYEETAKVMHKNRKQIENLLFRAKGTLKDSLVKEGFPI